MALRSLMGFFFSLLSGGFVKAEFSFETFQNRNSPDFVLLDSTRETVDLYASPFLNSVTYQYHKNPILYDQGEDGKGSLVSSIQSLNLTTEYLGWKNFSLGVEISFHQLNYYSQGVRFALGDTRVFSKIKIFGERYSSFGKYYFVPSVYAPTGNRDLLLSNAKGGVGGNFILEKNMGSVLTVANLGIDYFPKASFRNLNYETQVYAGLAAAFHLTEKWNASIEWMGRKTQSARTGDIYAGGQYRFSSESAVRFGGSVASTKTAKDDMEYRLLIGASWSPSGVKVVTEKVNTKIETIQKIETTNDCRPKIYNKKFVGRALTNSEKNNFVNKKLLPYISQKNNRVDIFSPGQSSGVTPEHKNNYVKNAQVLFAIDIVDLPERSTVVMLKSLDLSLSINKLWTPGEENTDMICLLKEKVCSGDIYQQKERAENINQDFFHGKEPPNDFFARQVSGPDEMSAEIRELSKGQLRLPISKLIENSTSNSPIDLIYSSKTLYFAVTHDIFVRRKIELNAEISANSCVETVAKPQVETRVEENKTKTEKGLNNDQE